ncbi:hypothetical protein Plim_2463 [Planctopirus limnophila DSM 3776]|uniref:Uncharacterized protein n=1 Tax=Planctopirus limnophila (strain ATCC 43296 / DSM 3776 / IFAM 1008 / Mu 290) TaxID=521674 RepID=D5SPE5_PLAL2|nr:hypothetical protein Plim_2463 [Planctopirus limnophila DSM 3776]
MVLLCRGNLSSDLHIELTAFREHSRRGPMDLIFWKVRCMHPKAQILEATQP